MADSEVEDVLPCPIRVLLVEDDPADAFLVQELLGPIGGIKPGLSAFQVTWVRTLADALTQPVDELDCVLLDLGLPGAQGMESLRAVKRALPATAVVVLTGLNDQDAGARAVARGAQDYLRKASVDEETLARAVRYAVVRARGEMASRRLREAELVAAERARLERGLLPSPLIRNPGVSCASRYQPGDGRALLGGDFYDGIEQDDGTIRIMIGDVCGHGADEAALGVALRVAWRCLVLSGLSPPETMATLEALLVVERRSEQLFATILDIELASNLRDATLWTGGHPSPLVSNGSGFREVDVPLRRPVLGAGVSRPWQANPLTLGRDWTLITYTDGLVEGRADGGQGRLTSVGLLELASAAVGEAEDLDSLAATLIAGAEAANGRPLSDDVALFIVSTDPRWGP